ncbi:MAG: GTP-binding protein [Candidatus Heimdallarchaeota archaeon]
MMNKKQADFLWKIVLTGDSFVGKTTIRKRAMGEHFAEEYISTVGADFSSYKARIGNLMTSFQIWDLAGQDKYKYIRSSFYGGATACFLVFDVTNPNSLNSITNWVDEAIRYSNGTIEIFIVCANKIDLKGKRVITRETGEEFANALKESSGLQCAYIETSALTGENIDIAFDLMAKCLLEREGITPVKAIKDAIEIPSVKQKDDVVIEETPSITKKPLSEPMIIVPTLEPEKPIKKLIMVGGDDEEETQKLIEEVMSVLDETNDVIIGREKTDEGERVITVPKNSIKGTKVEQEEVEPLITPELERVLNSINFQLDSLTSRLRDLEEEITNVKVNGIKIEEEKVEIEDAKDELRDDLDVLSSIDEPEVSDAGDESVIDQVETDEPEELIEENIIEEIKEVPLDVSKLDDDQKVLESILDFDEDSSPQTETEETSIKDDTTAPVDELEELVDLPEDDLVEIIEEEPLIPIQDDDYVPTDDSVIGTELSSAMISELKDMSVDETKSAEPQIGQHLSGTKTEHKNKCPICGEDAKFIRQYNKYYCVKCGRYLI